MKWRQAPKYKYPDYGFSVQIDIEYTTVKATFHTRTWQTVLKERRQEFYSLKESIVY